MERVTHVTFHYYEVWYRKRKYQILIPEDISQFWVTYSLYHGKIWGYNVDWIGNRKGFHALIHASDVLSQNHNFIIYFPCKKVEQFPHHYFDFPVIYEGYDNLTDLVLAKPNSLKISDWKEIRQRIPKTKAKKWKTDFIHKDADSYINKKYRYRKDDFLKEIFRFDTVFYLAPWYEYQHWLFFLVDFLNQDLENIFFDDISHSNNLRGEILDYFYYNSYSRKNMFTGEIGAVFWDNDIEKIAKISNLSTEH